MDDGIELDYTVQGEKMKRIFGLTFKLREETSDETFRLFIATAVRQIFKLTSYHFEENGFESALLQSKLTDNEYFDLTVISQENNQVTFRISLENNYVVGFRNKFGIWFYFKLQTHANNFDKEFGVNAVALPFDGTYQSLGDIQMLHISTGKFGFLINTLSKFTKLPMTRATSTILMFFVFSLSESIRFPLITERVSTSFTHDGDVDDDMLGKCDYFINHWQQSSVAIVNENLRKRNQNLIPMPFPRYMGEPMTMRDVKILKINDSDWTDFKLTRGGIMDGRTEVESDSGGSSTWSKQRNKGITSINNPSSSNSRNTSKTIGKRKVADIGVYVSSRSEILTQRASLSSPYRFCGRSLLRDSLDNPLIDKIPDRQNDQKTLLGELHWIFTAITDTIAWNVLPLELFQHLSRNFLLAERMMRAANCYPVSHPVLPPTHQHHMWDAWYMAAANCVVKLPNSVFQPSPFFMEQFTAFGVWLDHGLVNKKPPEKLPVVLQVLLSQSHRFGAVVLLGRSLDMGSWTVDLSLSVGIFPYVLKLFQTTELELRESLVSIWSKILALDKSCQVDCHRKEICLRHLQDAPQQSGQSGQSWLMQWLYLCLRNMWEDFPKGRVVGVQMDVVRPQTEVRAFAVFALGTLLDVQIFSFRDEDSDDYEKFKAEMNAVKSLFQVVSDGSPLIRYTRFNCQCINDTSVSD